MRHSERGNILFIILLAVILFAALAYAVTSSMRGGGKNVKDERAMAIAASVNDTVGFTEASLQRFMLNTGLSIENVDMFSTGLTMDGDVTSCSSTSCNLFDPAGGNVTVPVLPASAKSQLNTSSCSGYFTSANEIRPYIVTTSVKGVGTDLPDVVLYYCGVDAAVCEALNVANGLRNYGDTGINAGIGTAGDYVNFSGSSTNPMPTGLTVNQVGSLDSRINGQHVICGEWEKLGISPGFGNVLISVIDPR